MELSRRDAIAALAAGGIGLGGAAVYASDRAARDDGDDGDGGGGTPEEPVGTLVALAEVLYPSSVTGTTEFVETYAAGRLREDGVEERVSAAVDVLDAHARERAGAPFRRLSPDEREAVLEALGQRYVSPDPEGDERERVRYALVNELLYALFTSPKGGALAGTTNPAGHPGGLEAYHTEPGR